MNARTSTMALLLVMTAAGCASPRGDTAGQQRRNARQMRTEALERFDDARPGLRQRVQSSAGYAVFSNLNVQLFIVGVGQGFGVAHDNGSGGDTYMGMAQIGLGFGAGAKDYRVLFIFHDKLSFRRFVEEGWEFGADADAAMIVGGDRGLQGGVAATVGSGGASAGVSGSGGTSSSKGAFADAAGSGFEVYQLTVNGLALKAMLNGTKYWKDSVLN